MFNAISNWKYWCPKLLSVTRAKQKFKILGFCVCWWMLRNSFNWHREWHWAYDKEDDQESALFVFGLTFISRRMLWRHEITIWGICVVKTGPCIWFCVLLRYLYQDWVLRAEHMTCWGICGLNRPLKVWMIRTRVSWSQPAEDKAGGFWWMEPMFCPRLDTKVSPQHFTRQGWRGGHGWQCSKIFTPRTRVA